MELGSTPCSREQKRPGLIEVTRWIPDSGRYSNYWTSLFVWMVAEFAPSGFGCSRVDTGGSQACGSVSMSIDCARRSGFASRSVKILFVQQQIQQQKNVGRFWFEMDMQSGFEALRRRGPVQVNFREMGEKKKGRKRKRLKKELG